MDIINRLGYIQIDTISVIERAHHHVLWSRIPHYKPALVNKLESDTRQVFEYWSHAASYLPIASYPFTLPLKMEIRDKDKFWQPKDPRLMQYVLDRIKAERAH